MCAVANGKNFTELVAYLPPGHNLHDEEIALKAYLPCGHPKQLLDSVTAYCPASQFEQDAAPENNEVQPRPDGPRMKLDATTFGGKFGALQQAPGSRVFILILRFVFTPMFNFAPRRVTFLTCSAVVTVTSVLISASEHFEGQKPLVHAAHVSHFEVSPVCAVAKRKND